MIELSNMRIFLSAVVPAVNLPLGLIAGATATQG